MFNHESPRRGGTFVTKKITQGLSNIAYGLEDCIYLGNLDSKRDWGHARDYVEMQWLMLQQDEPEDFVIATGRQISIRDFISLSAKQLDLEIEFVDKGLKEYVRVVSSNNDLTPSINEGDIIFRVSPQYFRPTEVDNLLGNASKASTQLGWEPKTTIEELCKLMIEHDIQMSKQDALLKQHGFDISIPKER